MFIYLVLINYYEGMSHRRKCWTRKSVKNLVLKDVINPYTCLSKNANFSIKTSNDQITSYIIILDGITYSSVQFYNSSLLVFKLRFQVFSLSCKKVQGFSIDRKLLMSLLSVLFHIPNRVSIF